MISNEDLRVLVRAVQENAFRLGLTWELGIATVITFDPLTIRLDGDTVDLSNEITNITGQRLNNGDRVYVLILPPNTIYVIGFAGLRKKGCTLRRVASQTLNDAIVTGVIWDTEDEDTNDMWESGTDVTIPFTGMWAFAFCADFSGTAGRTFVEIANVSGFEAIRASVGDTSETKGCATVVLPMTAGDTFLCRVFRDAAAGGTMTARLTCYRVDGGG